MSSTKDIQFALFLWARWWSFRTAQPISFAVPTRTWPKRTMNVTRIKEQFVRICKYFQKVLHCRRSLLQKTSPDNYYFSISAVALSSLFANAICLAKDGRIDRVYGWIVNNGCRSLFEQVENGRGRAFYLFSTKYSISYLTDWKRRSFEDEDLMNWPSWPSKIGILRIILSKYCWHLNSP